MNKSKILKAISLILTSVIFTIGLVGCDSKNSEKSKSVDESAITSNNENVNANTSTINIVWYPNESSDTHAEVRTEVEKLAKQATGREAKA